MKIGIVWLPNVWKSTLFNALINSYSADAANFPFCTIEPNIGIVDVKDERIDKLSDIYGSSKKVYANIKFVDIAGLVKWASKWEGMWNKFLSNIRETDAIVQVLRYFQDDDIGHVDGNVDTVRDAETINMELIFADMEQIEKKLKWLSSKLRCKDKDAVKENDLLLKAMVYLEAWKLLCDLKEELSEEEQNIMKQYQFLTYKSIIYALNVWTEDLPKALEIKKKYTDLLWKPVAIVCVKLESEMIGLEVEEKEEFLSDALEWVNFTKEELPTLDTLIKLAFDTVWLMYYFTSWEKETRAWTVLKWSTAPRAAAAIHNDFERWFIKAEVVNCQHIFEYWSWSKSKENGKLSLEWKDYIVQDGDVIIFKFNV